MPKTHVAAEAEPGVGTRAHVESDRLEDGQRLMALFTDEGMVFDALDAEGTVVKTLSTMYDEFVDSTEAA